MDEQTKLTGDYGSNMNGTDNQLKAFGSDQFRKNQNKSSFIPESIVAFLKRHLLVVLIVTGALIGFIIGLSINEAVQKLNPEARYNVVILIGFPGELLLRMLKMLILPLITFSLILGVSGLSGTVSGKIGLRGVVYYISTTCIAAVIGLILVSAIRPGDGMSSSKPPVQKLVRPLDSFMDIVRNMFPANIVGACISQDRTKIMMKKSKEETGKMYNVTYDVTKLPSSLIRHMVKNKIIFEESSSDKSLPLQLRRFYSEEKEYKMYKTGNGLESIGAANFLGLIVFSIAVGKIAGSLGADAETFISFIASFNKIITRLVVLVMWYSPVGIASLIMAKCAEMEDMNKNFSGLALFIVTVILGIAVHGLIVLPAIFFFITRTNPYIYVRGIGTAMATAFGTDSSAATLPITLQCLEENLKLDKRITRFIVPVGTTINMDGTALYEAVSAIFIAQASGFSLSVGDYIAISFTSILASIGAAAIPHAGLVTLLIVLDTVGLPNDMIAIILSVDWFLDRIRTMINVAGDAFGAGIVQHLSKADLQRADLEERERESNYHKHHGDPSNITGAKHGGDDEKKRHIGNDDVFTGDSNGGDEYDPRLSTYC